MQSFKEEGAQRNYMPLYLALSTSSVPYFSLSPHQGLYQYNNYRKKVNERHTHSESLCMGVAKVVCAQACLVVVGWKSNPGLFFTRHAQKLDGLPEARSILQLMQCHDFPYFSPGTREGLRLEPRSLTSVHTEASADSHTMSSSQALTI